jgi:hypothetical protein
MSIRSRTSGPARDSAEGSRRNRSFSLWDSSLKRVVIHLVPDPLATHPGKAQSTKKTVRKANAITGGNENRRRLQCNTTITDKTSIPAIAMAKDRESARVIEGR